MGLGCSIWELSAPKLGLATWEFRILGEKGAMLFRLGTAHLQVPYSRVTLRRVVN